MEFVLRPLAKVEFMMAVANVWDSTAFKLAATRSEVLVAGQ